MIDTRGKGESKTYDSVEDPVSTIVHDPAGVAAFSRARRQCRVTGDFFDLGLEDEEIHQLLL